MYMYRVCMHGIYGVYEPELGQYRVYRHDIYGIHCINIKCGVHKFKRCRILTIYRCIDMIEIYRYTYIYISGI